MLVVIVYMYVHTLYILDLFCVRHFIPTNELAEHFTFTFP